MTHFSSLIFSLIFLTDSLSLLLYLLTTSCQSSLHSTDLELLTVLTREHLAQIKAAIKRDMAANSLSLGVFEADRQGMDLSEEVEEDPSGSTDSDHVNTDADTAANGEVRPFLHSVSGEIGERLDA